MEGNTVPVRTSATSAAQQLCAAKTWLRNEERKNIPYGNDVSALTSDGYSDAHPLDGGNRVTGGGQMSQPPTSMLHTELKLVQMEELLLADMEWTCRNNSKVVPLRGSTAYDFTVADYGNLLYHMFGCVIRQHSRLTVFRRLQPDDQLALVKGTPNELLFIRTLSKYSMQEQCVTVQYPGQPKLYADIGRRIREPVGAKFRELAGSMPESWRTNQQLMLILSAVAFFNPDQPEVTNKTAVNAGRRMYLQLLQRHLMDIYRPDEATYAYRFLVIFANELSLWTKKHCRGVIFEVNPESFELLLLDFSNFE